MDHVINILLVIFVTWIFDRIQMAISAPNYYSVSNGMGAIDLTNEKNIHAPMAYRVLVPWLVKQIESILRDPEAVRMKRRVLIYQYLKMFFVFFGFLCVYYAWGIPVMLVTAGLLLATIHYDYWDWPIEMGVIALALTGNFWLILGGVIIFALSRETAPIVGVVYFLKFHEPYLAGILFLTALVVNVSLKAYIGERSLYCKRWMLKTNIELLQNVFKYKPFFYSQIFVSIIYTALIATAGIYLLPTGLIPLVLLGAGWLMAKADEPRVFNAALPWAAAFLLKGV